MIVAGVDSGSATTKMVVLKDGYVGFQKVVPTGSNNRGAVSDLLAKLEIEAGLALSDLDYVVSTGYGRSNIKFAQETVTEITCQGIGVHWLFPNARLVIDVGGQDSKIIILGKDGKVINFRMNEKCAAGTGRFLEVMSMALDLELGEFGKLSTTVTEELAVSSTCTVFAESEVVSHVAKGANVASIVRGIHESITQRIYAQARGLYNMGMDVAMTGGVARNTGIVGVLGEKLDTSISVPAHPQTTGALGAAIIGQRALVG